MARKLALWVLGWHGVSLLAQGLEQARYVLGIGQTSIGVAVVVKVSNPFIFRQHLRLPDPLFCVFSYAQRVPRCECCVFVEIFSMPLQTGYDCERCIQQTNEPVARICLDT